MQPTATEPELLPLGPDGIVVRFATVLDEAANRAAIAFRAAVEEAGHPGIVETAPALGSVLVRFDRGATTRQEVTAALGGLLGSRDWLAAPLPAGRRLWRIPAAFGGDHGPQLAEAARLAGLSEAEAVAEIAATPLRVLAIGFAPGQPYIGMLPGRWNIPRLAELTPAVPAGALVVAVRQLVLFANASPTGWRHVGRTAFRAFRPEGATPFPLNAGDEIRIAPVSHDEMTRLIAGGGTGGATCEKIG